jgi:hypothetical protein
VVRSDGSVGQYGLGVALKRALLSAEGVDLDRLERLAASGVRFVGSETTQVFCVPSCGQARRVTPVHAVFFRSVDAALTGGYRPCSRCRPTSLPAAS